MLIIIVTLSLVSIVFAPLGCISLWKKYIYFSDGFAHASILAICISVLANLPLIYAGCVMSVIFVILILALKYRIYSADNNAIIGLVSNGMLSLALMLSFITKAPINLNHLLFGDIVTVTANDCFILVVIAILTVSFICIYYKRILLALINHDIAKVHGVKVHVIESVFLILLSFAVFTTIKIVGTLLVTSILIIPAITARLIASTPWIMITLSVILALIFNFGGLIISLYFDTPVSPAIVLLGTIVYLPTHFIYNKLGLA